MGLVALCALLGCGCSEGGSSASSPETAAAETAEAATESAASTPACEEKNRIRPVCGFKNPEDLAVVPGGDLLLVSEMAAFLSDGPGVLSLLDLQQEQRRPIEIIWQDEGGKRWGDSACAEPRVERFSPHGIDLMTRADGRHQVLVVNYGDERVEFFELAETDGVWRLYWRGCATPPGDPFINDVAGLPGGGFVATHMWDKSTPFDAVVARLTAGEATGWVWQWLPETGFSRLPNSEDLMPNGIAVSPDGEKVFVDIYMGNKTVKFDRASGNREGEFSVRSPDNIVLGEDGYLWVASHLNDPVEGRCPDGHPGPCLLPFQVVRADPETMTAEVVYQHEGEPMGYATVALPHAGRLYLGTASGDRLASIELR
jgi:hypothetical protein